MSDIAQEISRALDDLERIERDGERPARYAYVVGWLLGTIKDLDVRAKLKERLEAGPK